MDETLHSQPKLKTSADYKAAFTRLLAEMDQIEQRMDMHRTEVEILKVKTQMISERTTHNLARLQAQVDSIGKAI